MLENRTSDLKIRDSFFECERARDWIEQLGPSAYGRALAEKRAAEKAARSASPSRKPL
jgi:hypothetical protein